MKKFNFFMIMFALSVCSLNAQTYSNGPLSTGNIHVGTNTPAVSGYTWSQMQGNNTNFGYSGYSSLNLTTTNFVIADDFVVPAGETWTISSISGFAYQTGYAGASSPFIGLRVAIYDGVPGNGGNIIHGDLTTNVYSGATDAFIHRTSNTAAGTTRRIWKIDSTPLSYELPSGTYWLAYYYTLGSGGASFTPAVTIVGQLSAPNSNARQKFTDNTWLNIVDNGNPVHPTPVPQAIPFQFEYTSQSLGDTTLRNDFCGVTLNDIGSNMFATAVPNFEEYTFEVTNMSTMAVNEVISPNRWFNLINAGLNPTYGTNYSVKVKVKVGGSYNNYGAACMITTPTLPTTQLRSEFCNANISSLGTNIYAQGIKFATEYTFEVTNTMTNDVDEVIRPGRFFNLVSAGLNPTANTTYSVRVKAEVNGAYNNYGTACTVTTPGVPALLSNGYNNMESSSKIETYPNPFTQQFTIKLMDLNPATIQVYDVNGRLIENRQVEDTFEIELGHNFDAGVYLLTVEQNGENQTFKMIKK